MRKFEDTLAKIRAERNLEQLAKRHMRAPTCLDCGELMETAKRDEIFSLDF
jgi:hypothetical protein